MRAEPPYIGFIVGKMSTSAAGRIKAGERLFLRCLKQALIRTNEARLVTGGVVFERQTTRELNGIISAQGVPTY